jgi:phospholipid-binding lipoprotein MlaA
LPTLCKAEQIAVVVVGESGLRRSTFAVVALLAALAQPAGAWAADGHTPGDPWERANRVGYSIHQFFDRLIIRPVAMTYKTVLPSVVRLGVRNVINNLDEPVVAFNDLFQGHPRRAGATTVRFVTNSTLGVAGIFDVAATLKNPHHDNGFALTMGRAKVAPGPYLFIPLAGPTTVRDLVGGVVDGALDPFHWFQYRHYREITVARPVVGGVDKRAEADADLTALMADATDPYATLRSVYLQNQQSQIDGDDAESVPALPDFDTPPAPTATPAPNPTAPAAASAPGPSAAASADSRPADGAPSALAP